MASRSGPDFRADADPRAELLRLYESLIVKTQEYEYRLTWSIANLPFNNSPQCLPQRSRNPGAPELALKCRTIPACVLGCCLVGGLQKPQQHAVRIIGGLDGRVR